MTWLQGLLLGLISGITEFLPVSAEAHRGILYHMMNLQEDALFRFLLHGASLAALLWMNRRTLYRMRLVRMEEKHYPRSRRMLTSSLHRYTLRLWRAALLPVLLGFLVLQQTQSLGSQMNLLAIVLVCNGMILFLPSLLPHGNRDGRTMSPADGFFMGLGCCFGFVPGISRAGASLSIGVARGVDKPYALRLGMLIWIPCMLGLLILDVMAAISTGLPALSAHMVLPYLLGGGAAFLGSYLGILFLRFLSAKVGFSGFCYYSWGLALFAFILYLAI